MQKENIELLQVWDDNPKNNFQRVKMWIDF